MVSWVKNLNQELGGKNEKGERKKEENYIKKGEKGLKNASFWDINFLKIFTGGLPTTPLALTYLSEKKNESQKRGKGNDQNAQYISLYCNATQGHNINFIAFINGAPGISSDLRPLGVQGAQKCIENQ